MESFWEVVKRIMKGLGDKDVTGLAEFQFDTENIKEAVVTFHTNDDGNMVMSVFDQDQWSLIEDMARFVHKPVEDIVKDLDPSGPNIFIVDPDDLDNIDNV
jgi:hypothetical protein